MKSFENDGYNYQITTELVTTTVEVQNLRTDFLI